MQPSCRRVVAVMARSLGRRRAVPDGAIPVVSRGGRHPDGLSQWVEHEAKPVVDGRYLVSGAVDVEHYIRVVEHVEAERAGEASSPE